VDGTASDRFANNRLFRPATLNRVLDEYPNVVILLARAAARISFRTSADGIKHVVLLSLADPHTRYQLRVDDYSRCVDVARKMGQFPIFPTEPFSDIISRIRALLSVEFADRGDF
jgi:hypothetical protein